VEGPAEAEELAVGMGVRVGQPEVAAALPEVEGAALPEVEGAAPLQAQEAQPD